MNIHYVIDAFPEGDYSLFAEKIKQHSSKRQEKKAMTIAEKLIQRGKQEAMAIAEQQIQRGKQESIQQGMQQGAHQIAEKMVLRGGFSAEIIASLTGLTVAEINAIKKEIEH